MRIERRVERQTPFSIVVEGETLPAYPGETIAAVLIERSPTIGRTASGAARGLFCNMGTCSLCMVTLLPEGRRVRACLTPAEPGLEIGLV
jgi:D-hydroxyproline dehydrogenase subunit gamma